MKDYDVIVVGSGSGASIANVAASEELKVAMIDKGPLIGGTCLNLGCFPVHYLREAAIHWRDGSLTNGNLDWQAVQAAKEAQLAVLRERDARFLGSYFAMKWF
ncbi:MAG: FAD-dependent oxidoreductase, partial [Dehalococcoidales bacterium]|nr:FAD-dependent oxidoreductase [Dehalococcoidales bacterium]